MSETAARRSVDDGDGAGGRRAARRVGVLATAAVLSLAAAAALLASARGPAPAQLAHGESSTASVSAPAVLAAAPPARSARLQELSSAEDLAFRQPYVPPADLFIFWGKSSFKGHYALGRVSSAQRVRKVLGVGHFTGNQWEDSHHGHGKFLRDWDSAAMQALARSCCSTIVVPPMENDLPLYFKSSEASVNIKSFVSNGNRLVMTGGAFTSLVFLNRYFDIGQCAFVRAFARVHIHEFMPSCIHAHTCRHTCAHTHHIRAPSH